MIKFKINQRKKLKRQKPYNSRNRFELNAWHEQDARDSVAAELDIHSNGFNKTKE